MSVTLKFLELDPSSSADARPEKRPNIAKLTISRPDQANALNAQILKDMTDHLNTIHQSPETRLLILTSQGKHFSAGADLGWMKDSAKLTHDQNFEDAGKLSCLFEALTNLDIPSIALAKGASYGGAIGLLACCDIVLATEDARFCLSELKLGLLPGVILPYLLRKMGPSAVKRYGLSARLFKAEEAYKSSLVDRVVSKEDIETAVLEEVNACLQGGPNASRVLKSLIRSVEQTYAPQDVQYQKAIAHARSSEEGQKGLQAFFDKNQPFWNYQLQKGALLELI